MTAPESSRVVAIERGVTDERADTVSRRRGTLGALAWNLALEAELVRVLALLDPLEVVVFKGPLLTRQIYGDLRQRISSDNDLLIRPEDVGHVLWVLFEDGYEPLPYDVPERTLRATGRTTLLKRVEGMLHSVDLHTEAFSRPHFSVPDGLVREHLEGVEVHGRTMLRFDRHLAFAHLVAHFVQHRFEQHILRDLGAAWTRWQVDLRGIGYREFAARTCTVEALEYSLTAAQALGFSDGPSLGATTKRARLVLRGFRPERIQEPVHLGYVRGFWSTLLVRPSAVPKLAWRGIVLPEHELEVRHQAEYRPAMRWQRLQAPLTELKARLWRGIRAR